MLPGKQWIFVLLPSISAVAIILVHMHWSNGEMFLNGPLPRMKQTIFKCDVRRSLVKNYHRHDFLQDRPFRFNISFKNPCWYEDRSLRCLPYFLVMGIRKSGTTYLYSVITKHPDVINWGRKETQFFGHGQEQHGKLPDRMLKKMMVVRQSNTRFDKYIQLGPMLNTTRLILTRFYRQFNERMANLMNDPYFLFE